MAVPLHGKRLEPALPHVPAAAMPPMMPPDMRGHHPLHPSPEVAVVARPEQQVKMVRHHAVPGHPHGDAPAPSPNNSTKAA